MSTPTPPASDTPTAPEQPTDQQQNPAPQQPQNGQQPRTYSEDDIARARQQEKEKLYNEIEQLKQKTSNFGSMQEELENLRKEREERQAAEEKARKDAEEAERARSEEEMSAKQLLDERTSEWESKFQKLEEERAAEKALMQKEREFAELRDYIHERVQAERENIAPELLDLVDGSTREEVDASIERLRAKSEAIAEKIRGTQQQLGAQQQGVSPSGFNPAGPMDMLPSMQNYSAEDINNMSPREFAEKIRPSLFGGDARNRGMYG